MSIKLMIDVILIALIGACVFECGRLSAVRDDVELLRKECAFLEKWHDASQKKQAERPQDGAETDFEDVKIWKPRKE